MRWHCSRCGMNADFKGEFEDHPCEDGFRHEIHRAKPKRCELDDDDEELDDMAHAESLGYGPNDYAKTMGLDQDPDWDESFDLDDIGEGE